MPTTLSHTLPDAPSVARTISGLIGRNATPKPGKPFAAAPRAPVVFASYVEAGGKLSALLVADLPLAASCGAALVMLPAVTVEEAVKAGKIADNVEENLREVLNVCAALFNSDKTPRVTLSSVTIGEKAPDAVAALLKTPGGRLDLELAIPGYPGGRISLLAN